MRASLNISLPQPLKKWVEKQTKEKGFSTTSEFVRDMIRREKAQEARRRVDNLLLEAMENGEPTPMTAQDWQDIRREGRKLAAARMKQSRVGVRRPPSSVAKR